MTLELWSCLRHLLTHLIISTHRHEKTNISLRNGWQVMDDKQQSNKQPGSEMNAKSRILYWTFCIDFGAWPGRVQTQTMRKRWWNSDASDTIPAIRCIASARPQQILYSQENQLFATFQYLWDHLRKEDEKREVRMREREWTKSVPAFFLLPFFVPTFFYGLIWPIFQQSNGHQRLYECTLMAFSSPMNDAQSMAFSGWNL